jgi:hypothetical protein
LYSTDPAANYLGTVVVALGGGGQATFAGVAQFTAGPQALVATDSSLYGTLDFTVL